MGAALIVGGDGAIGRALASQAAKVGWKVVSTNRRPGSDAALFLDLARPVDPAAIAPEIRRAAGEQLNAFLLAGVTGYLQCERDRALSRRVNVDHTVALAQWLMEHGAFIVFPSSTAVFSSRTDAPAEMDAVNPATEYGRQKAESEQKLLALARSATRPAGAAVLRLTKVMHPGIGWFADWLANLTAGRAIQASSLQTISPVSRRAAAEALLRVAQARRSGIYHFGGEHRLSYFAFAQRVARMIGVDSGLVRPQKDDGPRQWLAADALSMGRVSLECGLRAQTVDSAVGDVVSDFRGSPNDGPSK